MGKSKAKPNYRRTVLRLPDFTNGSFWESQDSSERLFLSSRSFFGHTGGMCGRYRLSRRKQIIEDHFATDPDEVVWAPRYNIAPTQFVPVSDRILRVTVANCPCFAGVSSPRGRAICRKPHR